MFSRFVALALLLATAVSAQQCSRTYTVQAGDICDSISAAQHVSTYQLATVNPGIDSRCDNLTPGEQLCLGWVGSDCTDTYVVQPDTTCDSVASTYGINTTLLIQNNPQIDTSCDNMYIGEVLCVTSNGTSVAASSSAMASASATLPALSSTASVATETPLTTSVVSSTASGSASASAASTSATDAGSGAVSTGDDGDDGDDWPFCDEL